jgi:Protein of unknown function (DUF3019)
MLAASLLAVLPAILTPALASDTEGTLKLTVRPVLCILDRQTPHCNMSFLVHWESDHSGYYCLFTNFATAPLRCWSEERAGEFTEQRLVSEAFRYFMTPGASDAESELAAVTVDVLRVDDQDRRRTRRSRHVWDIL